MADLLKHLHWKLTQAPPTDARGRLLEGRTFTEREVKPLLEFAERVAELNVPESLTRAVAHIDALEDDEAVAVDSAETLQLLRDVQADLEDDIIGNIFAWLYDLKCRWTP